MTCNQFSRDEMRITKNITSDYLILTEISFSSHTAITVQFLWEKKNVQILQPEQITFNESSIHIDIFFPGYFLRCLQLSRKSKELFSRKLLETQRINFHSDEIR